MTSVTGFVGLACTAFKKDEKDDPQAVAKFKLLSHINELEDILQQNVRSNNFANALSVRAELGLARQELEDLESAASESTSKTTGTGTIQVGVLPQFRK